MSSSPPVLCEELVLALRSPPTGDPTSAVEARSAPIAPGSLSTIHWTRPADDSQRQRRAASAMLLRHSRCFAVWQLRPRRPSTPRVYSWHQSWPFSLAVLGKAT